MTSFLGQASFGPVRSDDRKGEDFLLGAAWTAAGAVHVLCPQATGIWGGLQMDRTVPGLTGGGPGWLGHHTTLGEEEREKNVFCHMYRPIGQDVQADEPASLDSSQLMDFFSFKYSGVFVFITTFCINKYSVHQIWAEEIVKQEKKKLWCYESFCVQDNSPALNWKFRLCCALSFSLVPC